MLEGNCDTRPEASVGMATDLRSEAGDGWASSGLRKRHDVGRDGQLRVRLSSQLNSGSGGRLRLGVDWQLSLCRAGQLDISLTQATFWGLQARDVLGQWPDES